jgi:hypothetical protein
MNRAVSLPSLPNEKHIPRATDSLNTCIMIITYNSYVNVYTCAAKSTLIREKEVR